MTLCKLDPLDFRYSLDKGSYDEILCTFLCAIGDERWTSYSVETIDGGPCLQRTIGVKLGRADPITSESINNSSKAKEDVKALHGRIHSWVVFHRFERSHQLLWPGNDLARMPVIEHLHPVLVLLRRSGTFPLVLPEHVLKVLRELSQSMMHALFPQRLRRRCVGDDEAAKTFGMTCRRIIRSKHPSPRMSQQIKVAPNTKLI
jgi:hypothetical protein